MARWPSGSDRPDAGLALQPEARAGREEGGGESEGEQDGGWADGEGVEKMTVKTTPEKEQGTSTAEAASASGPAVQPIVRPNQQCQLGYVRKTWVRSKHCRTQLWQIVIDGRSCCQVRKDIPGSLEVALQLINMLIAGEAT